jgi:hypothetical protein
MTRDEALRICGKFWGGSVSEGVEMLIELGVLKLDEPKPGFIVKVRGNCGIVHSSFEEWQKCRACDAHPVNTLLWRQEGWYPGDQMALDEKIWKALRPLGQPLATQAALERAGLQIVEKT